MVATRVVATTSEWKRGLGLGERREGGERRGKKGEEEGGGGGEW